MRILITGGTGLIGQAVIKRWASIHQLTVLTRNVERANTLLSNPAIRLIEHLSQINFNELDAIVNLAGEPIANKKWSNTQKERICHSRWQLTAQLSQLINEAEKPPHTFISGSAIGYYGRQGEEKIDESYTAIHQEFTHHVCEQWESIALNAAEKTRVCLLRTGIVLSNNGGALVKMMLPFKLGAGAVIGSGNQIMSWIHVEDMVRIIDYALTKDISGAINATAPTPINNRQFSKVLAKTLNRPCWFSLPAWLMKVILGEQADLVIFGQHVIPTKLHNHGFEFKYPTIEPALQQILYH